jgi:hypothetical protein
MAWMGYQIPCNGFMTKGKDMMRLFLINETEMKCLRSMCKNLCIRIRPLIPNRHSYERDLLDTRILVVI